MPNPTDNGRPGGPVFLCVDLDLAVEMRRVAFPALCYYTHGSGGLKTGLERRSVVVIHLGDPSLTQAHQAAEHVQNHYWPKRVGTLDLTTMRFSGGASDFIAWWNSELEGNYESGVDFTQEALSRTKWKASAPDRLSESDGQEGYGSASDEELGIVTAESIKESPISWLWPYRFAEGEMALLAGDGGLGKSSLLLAIASLITQGAEWPDKSGKAPQGSVAIVSAEDSRETTLKPRLMALGADLTRIRFVTAKMTIRKQGERPMVSPMTLSDRPYWREVLKRIPGCRMLIVDPIPSYLGRGVNDSKNSELRSVVEPFIDEVTRPAGICFTANTHLNKTVDAKSPLHRITGSMAYGALPRNVHLVLRDPQRPERRLFVQAKCNIAPDDLDAVAYSLAKVVIQSAAGDIETSYPIFEAETTQIDLTEAMGGKATRRGPTPEKTMKGAKWLLDYLRGLGGLVAFRDVIDAAGDQGLVGELKLNTEGRMRWSNARMLYLARDAVRALGGDDSGWVIEDSKCGKVTSWRAVNPAESPTHGNDCNPSNPPAF